MSAPLLAYYGDDFTGSADVMEVLQWSGLRTVLFLDPPTPSQLEAFGDVRAFGVAGVSRAMSPAEMDAQLKLALERLRESAARIVHYKTCSTCDSSPEIGSIGKALELGREVFGEAVVPIVIAAPSLGRYQAFGNLFARSGMDSPPYRLDRHPTMRRHPVTPMHEADLRVHLGRQTQLKIELVDVLQLNEPYPGRDWLKSLDAAALLFDVLYPEHLPRIGQAIQDMADRAERTFVIGSSGVEYALAAHWSEIGFLESIRSHPAGRPTFPPTRQLVAITGSCSPVNDRQIMWAERNGFEALPLDPARLIHPGTQQAEIEASIGRAADRLARGANVILHSSRGPDDPRVAETLRVFESLGLSEQEIRLHSGRMLGPVLGKILLGILSEHRMERVAVAGGDTSGYVARELGITALEAVGPLAPGSPLCRIRAENDLDGLEVFFKGGQVGGQDVWGTTLHGTVEP